MAFPQFTAHKNWYAWIDEALVILSPREGQSAFLAASTRRPRRGEKKNEEAYSNF